MRAGNGKNKKITIIMVILAIVLGASLCSEKEHERATNQRTMVEENNIKYYFRGDSGDYSFDGARRVLNETPVEGAIKETVNYEDRLSVWREEGDIWKVTIEENIGETLQNTWHTEYRFRSGSDFREGVYCDRVRGYEDKSITKDQGDLNDEKEMLYYYNNAFRRLLYCGMRKNRNQ